MTFSSTSSSDSSSSRESYKFFTLFIFLNLTNTFSLSFNFVNFVFFFFFFLIFFWSGINKLTFISLLLLFESDNFFVVFEFNLSLGEKNEFFDKLFSLILNFSKEKDDFLNVFIIESFFIFKFVSFSFSLSKFISNNLFLMFACTILRLTCRKGCCWYCLTLLCMYLEKLLELVFLISGNFPDSNEENFLIVFGIFKNLVLPFLSPIILLIFLSSKAE